MKSVTKEEFDKFLENYPNKLTCTGLLNDKSIEDAFRVLYWDITLELPSQIVATYTKCLPSWPSEYGISRIIYE